MTTSNMRAVETPPAIRPVSGEDAGAPVRHSAK